MKGRIVIYSITGCPHCKNAKAKLDSLRLPYHDINLADHPEQREIMTKLTNRRTVPQIFFNEKHIGGNDDLHELTEKELEKLIEYVVSTPPPENAPKPIMDSETTDDLDFLSKKDELATLVEEFKKNSGAIQDHRQMLIFSNPNTFTGKDLVDFIEEKKHVDREKAFGIAKQLLEKKFLTPVKSNDDMSDDKTLFRLLEDSRSSALNAGLPAYAKVADASKLSSLIRNSILKLYSKYLSANGKTVDYESIGRSKEFEEYVNLSAQLQRVDIQKMSRDEKLAFFINIYNALVIHGNVKLGFPSNAWKRYRFFNNVSYLIGGYTYSLQDIENGVLRSNRKGIGMFWKPFSKGDPRLDTIVTPHEPLIHFALVCGAKSCPPIQTYSPEHITEELKLAASSFLESDDGCYVYEEEDYVGLSMIFKWYQEDFGENSKQVVEWIRDHMADGEKKNLLCKMIAEGKYHVAYISYDWGSNSK